MVGSLGSLLGISSPWQPLASYWSVERIVASPSPAESLWGSHLAPQPTQIGYPGGEGRGIVNGWKVMLLVSRYWCTQYRDLFSVHIPPLDEQTRQNLMLSC